MCEQVRGADLCADPLSCVIQDEDIVVRDDLRYLGSIHDEAESGHALHELEDPFESVDWSSYDVAAIQGLVAEMYARLDDMHTRYAVAIEAAVAEA